jgi:broad specificity phosphatase PhoE
MVDLKACGKEQAEALARRFWKRRLNMSIQATSTSINTAIPVASSMNLPIHYRTELRERNYGVLQGRPVKEYLDTLSSSGCSWEDFKPDRWRKHF